MVKIGSRASESRKYDVIEKDKRKLKLHWESDTELDEHLEAWTLQFQTTVDGVRRRCRSYRGLVVVPVDESRTQWSRVGYYELNICGMKAWQYGENWGDMATVVLV